MNSVIVTLLKSYMVVERLTGKSIYLLLYLYHKGQASFRQIGLETGMSHETVYNVMWNLSELRLIEERRERNKRIITLTEKGQLVVKLLLAIEEILRADTSEKLRAVAQRLNITP